MRLVVCRRDIEIIAREQEVLATASSSVLAIKVQLFITVFSSLVIYTYIRSLFRQALC